MSTLAIDIDTDKFNPDSDDEIILIKNDDYTYSKNNINNIKPITKTYVPNYDDEMIFLTSFRCSNCKLNELLCNCVYYKNKYKK